MHQDIIRSYVKAIFNDERYGMCKSTKKRSSSQTETEENEGNSERAHQDICDHSERVTASVGEMA